jgi:hypothetical protein
MEVFMHISDLTEDGQTRFIDAFVKHAVARVDHSAGTKRPTDADRSNIVPGILDAINPAAIKIPGMPASESCIENLMHSLFDDNASLEEAATIAGIPQCEARRISARAFDVLFANCKSLMRVVHQELYDFETIPRKLIKNSRAL